MSDSWTTYRFVILWDSGLSRTYDVRRQLRLLLRIRDSYERQGLLAAFPLMLVLAPDAHRATLWQAQALRLATERWLTHPLLGGALALQEASQHVSSARSYGEGLSALFPPAALDAVNPWQASWLAFASATDAIIDEIFCWLTAAAGHAMRREATPAQHCERHVSQHGA